MAGVFTVDTQRRVPHRAAAAIVAAREEERG